MFKRCSICDYFEGGDSILHNSLTDPCSPRRMVELEDGSGYICSHCLVDEPTSIRKEAGDIEILEVE